MLRLFENLFKKEEKTTKDTNTNTNTNNIETMNTKTTETACKKIEFYDKFIVIKNEKDDIIEVAVETYTYEYEPEVEELTGKGKISINLPKCVVQVSLVDNKDSIGEIVMTNILVRNEDVPFKVKIYTTEGLKAVVTEPTELIVDRFKLNITQK
ncbi:MAG: hypothetical protein JHC31_00025 [Sulfurihydrogenibium sp.]|jgi:hypothetical protein|nr:hypothetical protein [Sulfurihydrogenibium sp.]